jgi:hypothetical protein
MLSPFVQQLVDAAQSASAQAGTRRAVKAFARPKIAREKSVQPPSFKVTGSGRVIQQRVHLITSMSARPISADVGGVGRLRRAPQRRQKQQQQSQPSKPAELSWEQRRAELVSIVSGRSIVLYRPNPLGEPQRGYYGESRVLRDCGGGQLVLFFRIAVGEYASAIHAAAVDPDLLMAWKDDDGQDVDLQSCDEPFEWN